MLWRGLLYYTGPGVAGKWPANGRQIIGQSDVSQQTTAQKMPDRLIENRHDHAP